MAPEKLSLSTTSDESVTEETKRKAKLVVAQKCEFMHPEETYEILQMLGLADPKGVDY